MAATEKTRKGTGQVSVTGREKERDRERKRGGEGERGREKKVLLAGIILSWAWEGQGSLQTNQSSTPKLSWASGGSAS